MNIYDTPFCVQNDIEPSSLASVEYIARNKGMIIKPQDLARIFGVKNYAATMIKEAAETIIAAGKTRHMCFVNTTHYDDKPELISSNFMIDTAQSPVVRNAVSHISDLRDKVIVDLTSCTKYDGNDVVLTDVNALHAKILQAHIIAQDFDSGIPQSLANFIVRSYSIVNSSLIAKKKNVSFANMQKLRAIIALYYSQLVAFDSPDAIPRLFKGQRWLGNVNEFENMFKSTELLKDHMDVETMCEMMDKLIPELKGFDDGSYYHFANPASDTIQSAYCHEYPSYWMYMIFLAISNYKTTLNNHLRNDKVRDEALTFAKAYINTCAPRALKRM